MRLSKIKFSLLYLVAIAGVAVLFNKWPLIISLTETISFSPWSMVVGAWFVLRDYSQRELGHYVLLPMGLGVVIAAVVNPSYGLATVLAASASELADWGVYTFTRKPFHQRVLISSLVSAPIDTVIFFAAFDMFGVIPGVSIFNWATVVIGSLSKLVAALIIWRTYKETPAKVPSGTMGTAQA